MINRELAFTYNNHELTISYFQRPGKEKTILFLHGLGCAKNDFYGSIENQYLQDLTLIGIDFPGCGQSSYPENICLGIYDLVAITHHVIEKLNLKNVIIVGHSMSGLIGLLLAEHYPEKVAALINVEGNLAASDCFFSCKVAGMGRDEFINKAFTKYIHRVRIGRHKGLKEHAKILQEYSNPGAMRDVCPSLVEYSKTGNLLKRFLALKQPIQFIYGSQNRSLPYLDELRNSHSQVDEISNSGHFPFYDNEQEFYKKILNIINIK